METTRKRVKKETHRPLLNVEDPRAEIKKILDYRTPIYNQVADLKVNTSKLSADEAVKEIINYIKF